VRLKERASVSPRSISRELSGLNRTATQMASFAPRPPLKSSERRTILLIGWEPFVWRAETEETVFRILFCQKVFN
jgi:hypothetical protein